MLPWIPWTALEFRKQGALETREPSKGMVAVANSTTRHIILTECFHSRRFQSSTSLSQNHNRRGLTDGVQEVD